MPKLQDFRIEFDRSGATYEPGETVTGKVILNLSGPKNVREIRLEARGEAEVHWTKSRNVKDSSGRSHHHTDHYRGSEHYFSVSNRLIGGSSADGQITLAVGQHYYPFSFQIPVNIPCSIEHQFGHVRYTVKAVLDRPWRFDHKVVSAFTVVAPYDLNTQQSLTRGIDDEIKRNFFCCCCFNIGGMKVNVKSRVRGFVPGETIELTINFDNNSNRVDLTRIKLKLEKDLVFNASTPLPDKKHITETIRKVKQGGPFGKRGETSIRIEVPPLPPARLEHCSLIHVTYKLNLTLSVSGLRMNASRSYPIEIGTVPLYYRTSTLPQHSMPPYVPTAPPIDHVNPIPQPMPQPSQQIGFVVMSVPPYSVSGTPQSMPEMPPPSYEECVTGSNIIVDQNEQGMHGPNVQFAPKYPVYKFPMPMPYPP